MKNYSGIRVRIKEGHSSGRGGRTGRFMAVEVIVDIVDPLLLKIEAVALEKLSEDPLPSGWEEVGI